MEDEWGFLLVDIMRIELYNTFNKCINLRLVSTRATE